ncbi:hypothetical protein DFH08DRAFT_850138 [Mycena albidolilacea]|uniref:Uncharacterized protein n=1 Tax=Mycena albidolilacea TaxID=1033008 RepID=A0AAD7EYD7_9AGAR|nr:hypothetical protein DFH08DRAFT_850138 [Mycena albidolilacea]
MLEAFKIKPFDLEPVYADWTPAPRFLGDPKKDPPVDNWLEEIKNGCTKQNVPKEYWHTCAQHFMGDQAKARLTELKKVMAQVHGGQYRWNWKKFKVAMRNMSWDIDTSKTEAVRVSWWMPKSAKKEPKATEEEGYIVCDEPESITRSNTVKSKELASSDVDRPVIGRAATTSSFWPSRKNSKDIAGVDDTAQRPIPRKAKSEGTVVLSGQTSKPLPSLPNSGDVTNVPTWLLNAATALDFLKGEHPRVMSTLSAILIVAGTIPSLPVVSAGAAGAVLASSTAHAVGAIAIGLGSWIKTQQEGKSQQETHGAK